MINKIYPSVEAALADVRDGSTVMIGGFGTAGIPTRLIDGLIAQGAKDLTIVNNNAGNGDTGLAALLKTGRVRKIICSFPRQADSWAFYTPTGYGTRLAEGKETREIHGKPYVLEYPIHADLALIKAERADRWGNLTYRMTARNFGPIMATAARCTVVEVPEIVELGALDPEAVVTPGIFVHRVVQVERTVTQAGGFKKEAA